MYISFNVVTELVDDVWLSHIPGLSTCNYGEIRLTGGLSPGEGMVEMCVGRFFLVVDRGLNGWNQRTSFVICRQLQLPSSSEQYLHDKDLKYYI